MQVKPDAPRFFIALTLGQDKDHAMSLVECNDNPGAVKPNISRCQSLNYTTTVAIGRAKELISRELSRYTSVLIVDATMAGRPALDRLHGEPKITSDIHVVRFTAGDTEVRHDHVWRVPRLDLVSTMRMLQEEKRIYYGTGEEALLIDGFKRLAISIDDIVGDQRLSWRDETTDPRVWACAIGCWAALHPGINQHS